MPIHTVELGTRELIVLMELTSNAIEGDRFRYPDKSAAKRIHQKAEAALGFERATRLVEDTEPENEEVSEHKETPGSSEIVYCGPSLKKLLGEENSTNGFQ